MITTQKELRAAFWESHPEYGRYEGRKQNECPASVRLTWCDFVEHMHRSGEISDSLADRATL